MKTGIHLNVPEAEYFAIEAASNSTIGPMKTSAAHCKARMETPMEPTPNMRLGSAVHKLALEGMTAYQESYYVAQEGDPSPSRKSTVVAVIGALRNDAFDEFFILDEGQKVSKPRGEAADIADTMLTGEGKDIQELFAVTPTSINKKTKEGKAEYAEFQAKSERENLTIVKQENLDKACEYVNWIHILGEKELVKADDYLVAENYVDFLEFVGDREVITQEINDQVIAICESIKAHPMASKLLDGGESEVTAIWIDEETGELCKCRFDKLNHGYIVDLKTTMDASITGFGKSIANFGYHRQDAMYNDGYEATKGEPAKGFLFVAVETKPPYAVGVYNLDPEGVEKGREEYTALLSAWSSCKKSGIWPAYSDQVETIDLPRWYS